MARLAAAECESGGHRTAGSRRARAAKWPSSSERLRRVVREALDRVPQGRRLAEYFFRGGQSAAEAAGTRQGLEMLLDPVMAAKGAERLRRIADSSPLDPELLRGLMRLGRG